MYICATKNFHTILLQKDKDQVGQQLADFLII